LEVTIDLSPDGEDPISSIFDYVEAMRCSLWDVAFFREFKPSQQVHKNNSIDKQPNFHQALRRVLYRYFKYILLPRKAIFKVPRFFPNYLEPSSDECMYTLAILKAWDSCHYERCGWYMDCPVMKPPIFDIALRDGLQPELKKMPHVPLEELTPESSNQVEKGASKSRPTYNSAKSRRLKRKAPIPIEFPEDDDIIATSAAEPAVTVVPATEIPLPDLNSPPTKRLKLNPIGFDFQRSFTPPKVKTMRSSQPSSSSIISSHMLILNDSFVRMLEFKALKKKFPPSYDDLVAFLTKVFSKLCIFWILSKFVISFSGMLLILVNLDYNWSYVT